MIPGRGPYITPIAWTKFLKKHPHFVCDEPAVVDLTPEKKRELQAVHRRVRQVMDYRPERKDVWRVVDLDGEDPHGDCDDFVMTVADRLMARGWPRGALNPLWCQVAHGGRKQAHLVLSVRADGVEMICDVLRRYPAKSEAWVKGVISTWARERPGWEKWERL